MRPVAIDTEKRVGPEPTYTSVLDGFTNGAVVTPAANGKFHRMLPVPPNAIKLPVKGGELHEPDCTSFICCHPAIAAGGVGFAAVGFGETAQKGSIEPVTIAGFPAGQFCPSRVQQGNGVT